MKIVLRIETCFFLISNNCYRSVYSKFEWSSKDVPSILFIARQNKEIEDSSLVKFEMILKGSAHYLKRKTWNTSTEINYKRYYYFDSK